jgi:hypothetical protein
VVLEDSVENLGSLPSKEISYPSELWISKSIRDLPIRSGVCVDPTAYGIEVLSWSAIVDLQDPLRDPVHEAITDFF